VVRIRAEILRSMIASVHEVPSVSDSEGLWPRYERDQGNSKSIKRRSLLGVVGGRNVARPSL